MARDKVLWKDISLTAKQQFVSLLTIAEVGETILRFQQLVDDGKTKLKCIPCMKSRRGGMGCARCAYEIIRQDLGSDEYGLCCYIHVLRETAYCAFGTLYLTATYAAIPQWVVPQETNTAKHFCRAVIKHWKELLAIRKGMSKNDLAKHKRAAKRIVKGK